MVVGVEGEGEVICVEYGVGVVADCCTEEENWVV
jgi:hypothetical protein